MQQAAASFLGSWICGREIHLCRVSLVTLIDFRRSVMLSEVINDDSVGVRIFHVLSMYVDVEAYLEMPQYLPMSIF